MPLCTIIIPTFNSGNTLARALDSLLAQTFDDFEILIIDGLSVDNTLDVTEKYAARDKRIRHISEKDKGIYDAMNKGVDMARGQWVYFLGSDDRLYSNDVLATVFEDQSNLGWDVLYGNVYSTLFNGVYDGEFNTEKLLNRNICHQAIFLKKGIFLKTGKYDLKYKGYADWNHNFQWFLSDEISHKYIGTIIADYAEGGFSHASEDLVFKRDKVLNYLRAGSHKLPLKRKLKMLKSLLGYALMRKEPGLIARTIFYFPSIVLR